MLRILRRVWVVPGLDRVAVANGTIPAVYSNLATTLVGNDLLGPPLGSRLGLLDGARSLRARFHNLPAAGWVWNDVTSGATCDRSSLLGCSQYNDSAAPDASGERTFYYAGSGLLP